MEACAEILAECDAGGRTRLTRISGDGPLTVRPTGTAAEPRVHLIAGAFGPLGGDLLRLDVRVGAGARLDIAAVAATLALPDRARRPSRTEVTISVGAQASLVMALPPTIIGAGARHTVATRIDVASGGALWLREETVRGRSAETGGDVDLVTQLDVDGRPVLRQELTLAGPPAYPWQPRAVGSLLLVGPGTQGDGPRSVRTDEPVGAWLDLTGGSARQYSAIAADAYSLGRLLDTQWRGQLPR